MFGLRATSNNEYPEGLRIGYGVVGRTDCRWSIFTKFALAIAALTGPVPCPLMVRPMYGSSTLCRSLGY